jgi:hypothetical protein
LTYSLVDSTQYIGTNTYTYDSYNSSYTTFWTTAYTYTYMPVTTSSYTYYNERDLEQPTPIKKFKHVSKITEPGPRDTPVADATRDITPSSGPTAPPVPRVEVQSHKIRDADAADGHAGVPALEKRSKGGSSSSSSIFSSDLDSNYTSPLDTAGKLAKDEATVLIVLMIFGLLTIIWIVAQ